MHWNTSFFTAPRTFSSAHRALQQKRDEANRCASQPSIHVLELTDHWNVELDVPGVHLDDINITVNDGVMTIEGERKSVVPDNAKLLYEDRAAGKFRRDLRIGEGIDLNRIEAELRDGVLKITLFRSPEATPQKILIRNANS